MPTTWATDAVRLLRRDAAHADLSDRDLLSRFAARRDEAALAALIDRHGGLVRGTARRVLGNADDADDVFQATFFVLFRRAGARRWDDSVAGWLHLVALRLARRTLARKRCRRAAEDAATPPTRSPKSAAASCAGSSTRSWPACRSGIASRLSCVAWKGWHGTRRPGGSAGRSTR